MEELFHHVCIRTSQLVTHTYSTSFSIGVKCLHPSIRNDIYSIYGFVRVADEIVDTFHDYDRQNLLEEFEKEYYKALERKISLNPVLHSFQNTVRRYNIQDELVNAFFKSMKSDLCSTTFTEEGLREYIYGSADVVGLMCLKVFVRGDNEDYNRLKPYAMRLGSAFQKINFLRDLSHDIHQLHRIYFPILKTEPLNERTKRVILDEILEDYRIALKGIRQLPDCARLGVYTAYLYYKSLTRQIEKVKAELLLQKRIRISNMEKMVLLGKALLYNKFI